MSERPFPKQLILLLFFCTGATALVYEVLWSKYLSLMFGSTIQAQTLVLAVFMGGLALGNRVMGMWADRALQPLVAYGYVEAAVGVYAFFFNSLYEMLDRLFVGVGAHLSDHGPGLLLLKSGLSIALLLGPTFLMGATLPLLAAWLQKSALDAGRWTARFYSINSLGAVFGAWLAGFQLVPALGMVSALRMAALVNVLVGFTAVGLARAFSREAPATPEAPSAAQGSAPACSSRLRLGCLLVALTGGISMGLEVLSSRSLILLFGASLHAFAVVLMAFILGIGLGSAVIASPRVRHWPWQSTAIVLLLGAAAWVGILVLGIEQWVDVYRLLQSGIARSDIGYTFHQILTGAISMVVLGVPAALLGSMLPLWMRVVSAETKTLGKRVGLLLTWNTLGAVVGVLFAGFLMMPRIGLRGSFAVMVLILCLAALLLARRNQQPRVALLTFVLLGVLIPAYAFTGDGWRHVLSSGVFRLRETDVNFQLMKERRRLVQILYYQDSADATVSVEKEIQSGALGLRINGKPDASTKGDLATQLLLGHLPLLAHPDSRDVFILGLGSGVTAGAVLGHPVEYLTVAENCDPVVDAARFFAPWNRGIVTNSRARIIHEDARPLLKLNPKQYDVLICEPSNPWAVGVGSVFSREFFELASSRLKEDGIIAQWFHVYEANDAIVALVLRTFSRVFPYTEIWDPGSGDLILLGSRKSWTVTPEMCRTFFTRELPLADMAGIGLTSPATILARQLASLRTGFAIPGAGPIQSDAFPVLDYTAPKAFYIGRSARLVAQYDERTFQSDLAPRAKRDTLSRLSPLELQAIFKNNASVSDVLMNYLAWRCQKSVTGMDPESNFSPDALATVFRPGGAQPLPASLPSGTGPELKQLLEARSLIRSDSERWQEGAALIEKVLRRQNRNPATQPENWSPAFFASVAARAAIRNENWQQAQAFVNLGLGFDPKAKELAYLNLILERQQIPR